MGSSPDSPTGLSELQKAVLKAFFAREQGFYLTGGAALAGYHLRHRTTSDLDLFTLDPEAFARGRHVLGDLAADMDAVLEVVQNTPGFLRVVLTKDARAVVLDLVRDRSFQLHPNKPIVDGVAVDPADEILANKLTALVGRAEERDLVDALSLERTGLRIEDLLDAALKKDGGCTPATLAWLLSEVTISDEVSLPGGISPRELRDWITALIVRLRRAALPTT